MRLNINGETKDNISASTLKELLEELGIIPGRVAVEVNAAIVKRAEYDIFRLKDGDVLEIVNFVGGGSKTVMRKE
jgi:thiamine biosynthesis protein ThiS